MVSETEKKYTVEMVAEEFGQDYANIFEDITQYREFLTVLKDEILTKDDYQIIEDEDTGEIEFMFLKKKGYFKLKKAFDVRISLIDWKPYVSEKGRLQWAWFHVQAELNGEIFDAIGSADRSERGKNNSNDVLGTAHTRAIVRAISQHVDFGSVSDVEIVNRSDNGE